MHKKSEVIEALRDAADQLEGENETETEALCGVVERVSLMLSTYETELNTLIFTGVDTLPKKHR